MGYSGYIEFDSLLRTGEGGKDALQSKCNEDKWLKERQRDHLTIFFSKEILT